MSEQTSQEPTMEEILAYIRRIISEAEAPADAPKPEDAAEPEPVAAAPAEPEPPAIAPSAPQPQAEPLHTTSDHDVLDLTPDMAAPANAETIGDLDVYTPEPAAEPAPTRPAAAPTAPPVMAEMAAAPVADNEPLVSGAAAMAAASAFSQLAQRVAMPPSGQTLDDVVRELLRPLLKDWLDQHLAGIVQARVEQEVQRLARGGV